MGSKASDHDQILAAVVVALGRSSSKVANYNSEDLFSPAENDLPQVNPRTQHQHQHFFSCFATRSTDSPSGKSSNNSRLPNWQRSPSHIMSRLLLSPGVSSPDRILLKSASSFPAAADQSPSRASRFSGPLLSSSNKKKFKSGKKSKKNDDVSAAAAAANEREEPTSPKVTCMGTVKAPKKKCSAQIQAKFDHTNLIPNKWKRSKDHSGVLDLTRFGDKSGELRQLSSRSSSNPSGELRQLSSRSSANPSECVFGRSVMSLQQQQQQQQLQQFSSLESKMRKSMKMLLEEDDCEDFVMANKLSVRSNNSDVSLACRDDLKLKRPEEVCIWKRRCIPEPLRLDISKSS